MSTDNATLQELYNATSSSRWSYENDIQTLADNINMIDRNSPITDRYCSSILKYLGSDQCSIDYDQALYHVSCRIDEEN